MKPLLRQSEILLKHTIYIYLEIPLRKTTPTNTFLVNIVLLLIHSQ